MADRGSFGFKNINGKSIKLTVIRRTSDKLMDKKAAIRMQSKVVAAMNRAGKEAERAAKSPAWTPMLTGALIKSIHWEKAKLSGRNNIVRGSLTAGGVLAGAYARRQEFEHRTKRYFLQRAMTQVGQPAFLAELSNLGIYEEAFLGGIGFRSG